MDTATLSDRRRSLRHAVPDGAILIMGSGLAARNYADNVYPYRQDSSFLYYVGVSRPDMAALLLPDGGEILFGTPEHPDDLVWSGPSPGLDELAAGAGFSQWEDLGDLNERLAQARARGLHVHYLPPYRAERTLQLSELLGLEPAEVGSGASTALVRAVIEQRAHKSGAEIAEIESALATTAEMYRAAMAAARPGRTEAQVAAELVVAALADDRQLAFPPIVTVHGEVLHNTSYANTLADGDLLLIDSGSESPRWYASDVTRTFPVNGRFTPEQRDVYEVVLAAQTEAIAMASPAVSNRDLHLHAARVITRGLKDMGLMQGDVDEAVAAGAHALFFPHGFGHMLGLDVHDMEDLGDEVGYPGGEARSDQFGLNFLRLARPLEPGYVITAEPGVYFIPALIDRWAGDCRHRDFVCYDMLARFRAFGGIRIEDDVLITDTGSRVLGPGIPKTVADLEAALQR
jgi:Xaa-Pro aminopeptidase